MSTWEATNVEIGITSAVYWKVLSGGSPSGTADTSWHRAGYLGDEVKVSNDGVNEITVNAHPAQSAVKTEYTPGNPVLELNLMEIGVNNARNRQIAQGINPNDYAASLADPTPHDGGGDGLLLAVKLIHLPKGWDTAYPSTAVEKCIGIHYYKCTVDKSAYEETTLPTPEGDIHMIATRLKAQSDPSNSNQPSAEAVNITTNVSADTLAGTGPFADLSV